MKVKKGYPIKCKVCKKSFRWFKNEFLHGCKPKKCPECANIPKKPRITIDGEEIKPKMKLDKIVSIW